MPDTAINIVQTAMCRLYGMTRGMENTDSAIRLRLIDSTLFMIDRDGIDGARLKDIVEHADMTTGSLYWFLKIAELSSTLHWPSALFARCA